jgi:release factor glutamine methyltransferase
MRRKKCPWWRSNPINLQQTRVKIQKKLADIEDDTPANTALVLLSYLLKRPKSWVLAHSEYQLNPAEQSTLQELLSDILSEKPLAYILGEWSFYGRSFIVTPAVLIPRPETELLVEKAIQHGKTFAHPAIVDVGTGSGIIAVSLAAEIPASSVTAVDLSLKALTIARHNAIRHQQNQINFVVSHLLTPFTQQFSLICANLPYIPSVTLDQLEVAKREPRMALDGGMDGLSFISPLLEQAQRLLANPGVILLEIESRQGEQVSTAAKEIFPNAEVFLHKDLSGLDRLVEIIQK